MKWRRRQFSNYVRWEFKFEHLDTTVRLVVKRQFRLRGPCYWEAFWDCDRFKSSRFSVDNTYFDRLDKDSGLNALSLLFEHIRDSLSYGLNPKARVVMERMWAANKINPKFTRKQISGKRVEL